MSFESAQNIEEEIVGFPESKKYTSLTIEEEKMGDFEVEKWIENHSDEEIPMKMRRD